MIWHHTTPDGVPYLTIEDDHFIEDHLGKIHNKVEIAEEIMAERDALIKERDRYKAALEKIAKWKKSDASFWAKEALNG